MFRKVLITGGITVTMLLAGCGSDSNDEDNKNVEDVTEEEVLSDEPEEETSEPMIDVGEDEEDDLVDMIYDISGTEDGNGNDRINEIERWEEFRLG